ncbi:hypothetical protein E8E13_008025 [Curvularia kusanoi]|uniref:Uncharacterized protein n=1 Tax=Curvularia kusanoi TaxID=90978 RepID=A0A9P4TEZ3_CURKU|nr:hypothetical protein E8E13_008025 [Curvularia kusanoi]
MPTRPRRLERRRRERANAHIPLSTASLYHTLGNAGSSNALSTAGSSHTPSIAGPSQPTSSPDRLRAPLVIYSNAALFVRAIMHIVLLNLDRTGAQWQFFTVYVEHLEKNKPPASHASSSDYENGLKHWLDLVELHAAQLQTLMALEYAFMEQIVMWGLECSKAESEWDHSFILTRKLEVAQLKRETRKAVKKFEERVFSELRDAKLVFSAQTPKACFMYSFEYFRALFKESIEVAVAETIVEMLRETGRGGQV